MSAIPLGVSNETTLLVSEKFAISFLGNDSARVLATPWLIMHLEMTARNTAKPYLLDGEDTVGTHVNVAHLAATPIGMKARFRAEIIGVDGRKITFRVEAWDDRDKIAEGTHERAVINIAKFAERVQAKKVRLRRPSQRSAGKY